MHECVYACMYNRHVCVCVFGMAQLGGVCTDAIHLRHHSAAKLREPSTRSLVQGCIVTPQRRIGPLRTAVVRERHVADTEPAEQCGLN